MSKFKIIPNAEIYYNDDSLYGIYKFSTTEELSNAQSRVKDLDGNDLYTSSIVGTMQRLTIGLEYTCEASEVFNQKYKQWQYECTNIFPEKPNTIESQAKFLKTVVTEKQAQTLLEVYPNIVEMIINEEQVDLSKLKGIKEKTFSTIQEKVIENYVLADILVMLRPLGISLKMIKKIQEGNSNAIILKKQLLENPYILTKIRGLGFKKVDSLALSVNPNLKESLFRTKAYIEFKLNEIGDGEGHTKIKISDLDSYVKEDINCCWNIYLELIEKELVKETFLHIDTNTNSVGLLKNYKIERDILKKLNDLNDSVSFVDGNKLDFDKAFENFYRQRGYSLTDEQKKAVESIKFNNVSIMTGNAGCVDCDTEYFNGKRWVKISKYTPEDKVLQYNLDGSTTLVYPERYIVKPSEYLWHFKTKYGLDNCLSDDHTVVYRTSKGNLNKKKFSELKEMHESSIGGFQGKFYTTFKYNGEGIKLNDNEIELMCAVICDGYFPSENTNRCIVRLKKDRKKKEIEKILKEMNLKYSVNSSDGYSHYSFIAPIKEKEFSEHWYNCSKSQLQVIVDNVLMWDGSCTNGRKSFSTTSKQTADFIQFAFSSCGFRASISTYDRRGGMRGGYVRKSIEYSVIISKNNMVGIGCFHKDNPNKTKIEKYKTKDGKQYCFTVPSHMLVLRRNDKIFITGNCGKSSAIDSVVKAFKGYKIEQVALSAKASQRIAETTGCEAKTIHRLLGFNGKEFKHNEEDPVKADLIIVDEASMINGSIFLSLLKAIELGTKLFLVFDDAQLPPIGAGNIATDLLQSHFSVNRLTKVHRQAEASGILKDANIIRKGINPISEFKSNIVSGELKDMYYMFRENRQDIFDLTIKYYMKSIEKLSVDDICICVPRKANSLISTLEFNNKIQELLLGNQKLSIKRGKQEFKLGAKVIQKVNNYDKNVVNGEIGYIKSISYNDKVFKIDFNGKLIKYTFKEIEEIELAYALTIHACQGSQCNTILIPLAMDSYVLLSKELIYTAITRASKRCLMIAEPKAFDLGCKKKASKRNTWLQEMF